MAPVGQPVRTIRTVLIPRCGGFVPCRLGAAHRRNRSRTAPIHPHPATLRLPWSTTALGKVTSGSFIFKVMRAALPPDMEVKLPPTTVANIRAKGITEITVKTRQYGLAIELNGQSSPQLICNLDNLLAFAEHRDRWRQLAPSVSEQRFELVRRMVQDVLQTHNVDIRLLFPLPVRPHDSR